MTFFFFFVPDLKLLDPMSHLMIYSFRKIIENLLVYPEQKIIHYNFLSVIILQLLLILVLSSKVQQQQKDIEFKRTNRYKYYNVDRDIFDWIEFRIGEGQQGESINIDLKTHKHENDNHKTKLAATMQYIGQYCCSTLHL